MEGMGGEERRQTPDKPSCRQRSGLLKSSEHARDSSIRGFFTRSILSYCPRDVNPAASLSAGERRQLIRTSVPARGTNKKR